MIAPIFPTTPLIAVGDHPYPLFYSTPGTKDVRAGDEVGARIRRLFHRDSHGRHSSGYLRKSEAGYSRTKWTHNLDSCEGKTMSLRTVMLWHRWKTLTAHYGWLCWKLLNGKKSCGADLRQIDDRPSLLSPKFVIWYMNLLKIATHFVRDDRSSQYLTLYVYFFVIMQSWNQN